MTTIVSSVPFFMTNFLLDLQAVLAESDRTVEEQTLTSYVISSATLGITWRATGANLVYQPSGGEPPVDVLDGGTVTRIEVTSPLAATSSPICRLPGIPGH